MKTFTISPVKQTDAHKLTRQYLQDLDHVAQEFIYGEYLVHESEMEEYVKAAFIRLQVSGPGHESINAFLKDRMITNHFFVPKIKSMVIVELIPNPESLFDRVVYCLHLATGTAHCLNLQNNCIRGVRTDTAELIVQLERSDSTKWQWALFDITTGTIRKVFQGGNEYYLSTDGNFFFPVESSSQIACIDLASGQTLDLKNKRHFSRYATKVKIIRVIHFDPDEPCLYVLLMRQQELAFTTLKNETCIKLALA